MYHQEKPEERKVIIVKKKDKKVDIEPVTKLTKEQKKQQKQELQLKKKQDAYLLGRVPFLHAYDRLGMIEPVAGTFSRAYTVNAPDVEFREALDMTKVRTVFREILDEFSDFEMQFFIQNTLIPLDSYMDTVLLQQHREREVNLMIGEYNRMLEDNVSTGHNNFSRSVIFVLYTKADIADQAASKFEHIDEVVREKFAKLYGYEIRPMTLAERLYGFHQMFNPESEEYESIKEFTEKLESGEVSVKQMVRPHAYNAKARNSLRVGDKYVRVLFVNSFPAIIPDSILGDLMGISSTCLLSLRHAPMDMDFATELVDKLVESNTIEKKRKIRDTYADRQKARIKVDKSLKDENEVIYFNDAAKKLLDETKETDGHILQTSVMIALISEDEEALERDTKLLRISASKYACQIRTANLQQDLAFQSIFPGAAMKLDINRIYNTQTMSAVQPMAVADLFARIRAFHGLNEINDNFILLDRKNFLTGIISGVEHSGKSVAMKREMANTLMTTNDEVICITRDAAPLRKFASELGGVVMDPWHPDPFALAADEGASAKGLILSAYANFAMDVDDFHKPKEDRLNISKDIEAEVVRIADKPNWNQAVAEMNADRAAFGHLLNGKCLKALHPEHKDFDSVPGRLKIIACESDKEAGKTEYILMAAAVADYAKRKMKEGKTVWVYLEGIDFLEYITSGSDFLASIVKRMREIGAPLTMVVQDAVRIFANTDAKLEYCYLLKQTSYFKLLSQGPVERREYGEKLNIPSSLVPYITEREPGQGIIITPSANIAFNDRFAGVEDDFYKIFA